MTVPRTFEALVAEAAAASVEGWDFSWFEGRATEQRPSWGYARAMGERLARAAAALDIQTGGGEVLASAPKLPPVMVATEGWPPNLAKATTLLQPRGAVVVAASEDAPLPFADGAFDLVTEAGTPSAPTGPRPPVSCAPAARTSPSRSVPRASSNWSSTSSGRSRRRSGTPGTPTGPAPPRSPPGSTSSVCVRSGCASSSSTSEPSSTSCAR